MKKTKYDECCKFVKKKNLSYHIISKHRKIPTNAKPAIKALIKKKLNTINNMYIDIEKIKEYEGFKEYQEDKELNDYFTITDELKTNFRKTIKKIYVPSIERTNLKKTKTKNKSFFEKLFENEEFNKKIEKIIAEKLKK